MGGLDWRRCARYAGSLTCALALLFGISADVQAAAVSWTGGAQGVWNTASNWSTGAVPTIDDDVTIGAVTVSTTASIVFKSLVLNGSALYLNNPIMGGGAFTATSSANVYFPANVTHSLTGKVTVGGTSMFRTPSTNGPYYIKIQADEIEVEAGSYIAGFRGGYTYGFNGSNGSGPYFGMGNSAGGGGGGNAGAGGNGVGGAGGASTTCSLPLINQPGSGGGGGGTDSVGGEGGAVVYLISNNTTTINGTIDVSGIDQGNTGMGGDGGGGAGGSIRIHARTIAGSPMNIKANGGNGGTTGGGGGGGCVYVTYETSTSIATTAINVAGGTGANSGGDGDKRIVQSALRPTGFAVNPVIAVGSGLMLLTWTWPTGSSGNFFTIESSADGANYSLLANTANTTTLTATATGLNPARRYYFRIATVSSTAGTSTYATGSSVTIPANALAPTLSATTSNSFGVALNMGTNYISSYLKTSFSATPLGGAAVYYNSNGTPGTLNRFYPSEWSGTVTGLSPSTTYLFQNAEVRYDDGVNNWTVSGNGIATGTTRLATPPAPTFLGESSTTLNLLSWSQNGNPTTTPYSIYNQTLNKYHLADGSLANTPTYFPLSSWGGVVRGLSPGQRYLFNIILRKEDGSEHATSTAAGGYTLNADGTAVSLGGGSPAGSPTGSSSTTSSTSTSAASSMSNWYFGTPFSGGVTPAPVSAPVASNSASTAGATAPAYYTLPDGTIITPQSVFQMFSSTPSVTIGSTASVSLYKSRNLGSAIAFSRLPITNAPFLTAGTLSFRYTYINPNPRATYRVERVLLSPLGAVVARSTAQRAMAVGETIAYSPSQYLSRTLAPGLYTMRVRITSLDGKKIFDENSFDLELKRR